MLRNIAKPAFAPTAPRGNQGFSRSVFMFGYKLPGDRWEKHLRRISTGQRKIQGKAINLWKTSKYLWTNCGIWEKTPVEI